MPSQASTRQIPLTAGLRLLRLKIALALTAVPAVPATLGSAAILPPGRQPRHQLLVDKRPPRMGRRRTVC
jgi:hypothetical protein